MKWLLRKSPENTTTSNVIDIKTALPVTLSQIETQQVQTVNARDVHAFLGVGTAFKDWFPRRCEEYGFEDGKDFCSFLSESTGGRPATDYALTLSTAKELCMVEKNEQGKRARKYFIECERRALAGPIQQPLQLNLSHYRQLLEIAEKGQEKIAQLEQHIEVVSKELEVMEPKVETYDSILSTKGLMCVSDAAKQLGISCRVLSAFLEDEKFCYRRKDKYGQTMDLVPHQEMIDKGYMILRCRRYGATISRQTYITTMGLFMIERRWKKRRNGDGGPVPPAGNKNEPISKLN